MKKTRGNCGMASHPHISKGMKFIICRKDKEYELATANWGCWQEKKSKKKPK